jgi:hypothetical protein
VTRREQRHERLGEQRVQPDVGPGVEPVDGEEGDVERVRVQVLGSSRTTSSIPGCCEWNAASSTDRSNGPVPRIAPITTRPLRMPASSDSSSAAASTSASARRARATSRSPAGVNATCLVVRSTSAIPSSSSSRLICCESAGCAMCSRPAARVKCRSSSSVTR